ncbi:glutathione S-transferase [Rhizobium sp. 16-449-1b]|uniref:glutathione S-transferase family protein n=1 Tax=Rhizobium sp. 16-449-1b TaxID=2819989 RepID=UPI001ADAFA39|nr:glutathione S-transferase [Rhizobium sp. 16-449-1b]MBO9198258.1 glutathione S-transferase [Rhizobium sp. 16-449-1b]
MFIVHHLNNSRSQRVLWLLEELGFDYSIRFYKRNEDMSAPAELKVVHPLGKSPIVEDLDSSAGSVVLVETGAIVEYLVATADGKLGVPATPRDVVSYRQYLHYAEGSLMPILFASLLASKIPLFGRFALKRIRPMLDAHLSFVEQELGSREWFAGSDFTAADVMMSFPLEAAAARGLLGSHYPAIADWLVRIHARPAYHRALANGGPYAFGPSPSSKETNL